MATEQLLQLPLEQIVTDSQVRTTFDDETLHGLAQSLKEVGVLEPLRVRAVNGKYLLLAGERRFRAAKLAGLKTIAVIVESQSLKEGEVIQRQIIENCQREDLPPLEKATAIARLMELTGWGATETATRLGLTNSAVSRSLALLSLPESIQNDVAAGRIAPSAAYELSRVNHAETQQELAQQLASGRLTRDGLAGEIKSRSRRVTGGTGGSAVRVTAQLGTNRSVTVVGQELSLESYIEILEELLAKARKVRPQGVELATFIKMLRDQSRTM